MWKWWAVWGTVVLGLSVVTGFLPSGSRCIGHWSTVGFTVAGRVHGVAVGSDWQVIPPGRPDGWYEVTVPDSAREPSAVAVPGAAVVYPAPVWLIRVVLLLMVVVSLIVLMRRVGDRWYLRANERKLRNH